jgi:ubiquinone biosynthesis protein COQ4
MATNTKQRMQPLVAVRALRTLINDPEQTEQVFVVIRAMSGDSIERCYQQFRTTEVGRQVLAERRQLLTTLTDRQALAALPADALGRHYLAFVERERITAEGLVAASSAREAIQDPEILHYAERTRDMHDLWHVVTGYGRDTFGEACLLAFSYAQLRNRGVGIIALVGMVKLSREIGAGVCSAMWQAYRAGRKAAWLPAADWEHLLTLPIAEVRENLRVGAPAKYAEVFRRLRPSAPAHG